MNPIVAAIIGILIIFIGTSLGSALVFFMKGKSFSSIINSILTGFAAGVMLAASIFSLIVPALNDNSSSVIPLWVIVGGSVLLGAAFIWGIDKLVPHIHASMQEEGLPTNRISRNTKMFLAVTIHNVPEGLSVGIAFGVALGNWNSNPEVALAGALMLAIGIALQNIPEGAIVSLGVKAETGKTGKSFLFGVLSGAVEPVAAVLGLFLAMQIQVLMPYALSFAAGCMLYVIAEDMIPEMKASSTRHHGVWAFLFGFVLMMVMDVALG